MSTGADILKLADKHLGEIYILGARAPMKNANWTGPWDCAEFVSWCNYQAAGILYGTEPKDNAMLADAYTGYWAEQAMEDDAFISVEQAARIPGSCVLRMPASKRSGHIVFSDGQGGTIEAHSAAKGVCRETLSCRRWDTGILVPGVQYFENVFPTEPIVIVPTGIILRITHPLMQGDIVKKLQEELQNKGYLPGMIDGIYGPQTESAVIAFQNDQGLVPDGEVGDYTFAALRIRPV